MNEELAKKMPRKKTGNLCLKYIGRKNCYSVTENGKKARKHNKHFGLER
jgi:hypothetical protein